MINTTLPKNGSLPGMEMLGDGSGFNSGFNGNLQSQMSMMMQMMQMLSSMTMGGSGGTPMMGNFGSPQGDNSGLTSFLGAAPGGGGAMPAGYGGGDSVSSAGSAPMTGGFPASDGSSSAAVDIARQYMGQRTGGINLPGFTRNGQNDNNCAEFVSACLDKAGAYKKQPGDASVATLAQNLQKQGWKKVSKEQSRPGDVAVFNGSQHVELVSQAGGKELIGSNNKGSVQYVGTDKGNWGSIEYYSKGTGGGNPTSQGSPGSGGGTSGGGGSVGAPSTGGGYGGGAPAGGGGGYSGGGGGGDSVSAAPTSSSGGVNGAAAPSGDQGEIQAFIAKAAQAYGADPKVLTEMARRESSFNTGVVNDWDSNAKKGTPSKGLFQFIEPTFKSYAAQAKKANPAAWEGMGELNWNDWRQQALTASWAVANGHGSAWSTYAASGGR